MIRSFDTPATFIRITAVAVGWCGVLSTGHAQTRATPNEGVTIVNEPGPVPAAEAAGKTIENPGTVRRLVREVRQNTDNIKSQGDFGAQLWLVQGTQFFEDWKKPGPPQIDPVSLVPRGQTISTVIIFYGTARDNKGLSNVDYDLVVKRPDGTIYNRRDSLVGWQDPAPASEKQLMLGRNYVAIDLGPDDPSGLYTVEASVRDNVSQVTLPLKQSFVVQ